MVSYHKPGMSHGQDLRWISRLFTRL
jgi:hypothetical protein